MLQGRDAAASLNHYHQARTHVKNKTRQLEEDMDVLEEHFPEAAEVLVDVINDHRSDK